MKDEDKTKEQLIDELIELRREREQPGRRHLLHLSFLENLERINRVILRATDLKEMLENVLNEMMEIFDSDRAWLLYPCDPDAEFYRVPMECTKPEYPGAFALDADLTITSGHKSDFQLALETEVPITFGSGNEKPLPDNWPPTTRFSVKSRISMAIRPKTGMAWLFGMHQCSRNRVWTEEEQELFKEIGNRVADALSSLLFFQELRESEGKYRALIENANEIILVAQDGMIKFVNPKAAEVTGYSQTELTARPFAELIHPDDREMVTERYLKRLNGEEVPQTYSFRLISKSREIKWVDLCAALIDWEGKPATLNFLTDITERRQAEEELRQLSSAVEQSPASVVITDLDGNIQYVNPKFCQVSGYSSEEVLGQNPRILKSGEQPPEFYADMWKAIVAGQEWRGEFHNKKKNGELYWESTSVSPIRNSEGAITHFVAVKEDITEKKRMEAELLKIEKLESIGVLAGGIAHDLNNLLTGVLGNISLARMYDNPAEKDRRLAEAEKASMRIRDLTQQLLTFSKGGAPILQTANIAALLMDSATFTLRGSNVRCDFSIPDDLWTVEIDEGQINQVINNLVINAKQAMPDGGMIKIRAENTNINSKSGLSLAAGAYIKVSVEDRGIGIPTEQFHKIFDPFYTTKQAGSGLGLATSYSIIEKHNGHISVESQIGVGTTFHIYLPAFPEGAVEAEEQIAERPIMGEGRILVMDDEEMIGDLATNMLSSLGYSVTTTTDGAEAVEAYREAMESGKPFDAVILDLTIPGGMGGKETVQRLLEIDSEVKAIVSSGYSNDPVLADFQKYGFKGVVAKPYKAGELSEILHGVITGTD